jgi:membrane protein
MANLAREIWEVLKAAGSDWVEDKAAQLGAALSFYSVLSLAPLMVIALALAALVFGEQGATEQIMAQMDNMVGAEGAQAIQGMIENAKRPETGTIAAILGIVTLLFGASGVFGQLQEAMNTIWEVPPKTGGGFWNMIRARFLSFAMVLGTGFLLLISLLLSAAVAAFGTQMGHWWPALEPITHLINAGATFLVVTVLFAMIFKLLPDAQVAWRDVWVGALLTALLFTIGKLGIGLYLGKSAVGSTYGAAGSLVVLLLWIYYSAQILFFGAELTQVYATRYGSWKGAEERQRQKQGQTTGVVQPRRAAAGPV